MSKVKDLKGKEMPEVPQLPEMPQQPQSVVIPVDSRLLDGYINIIDIVLVGDARAEVLKTHLINLVKEAQKQAQENETSDK